MKVKYSKEIDVLHIVFTDEKIMESDEGSSVLFSTMTNTVPSLVLKY